MWLDDDELTGDGVHGYLACFAVVVLSQASSVATIIVALLVLRRIRGSGKYCCLPRDCSFFGRMSRRMFFFA